MPAPAWERRQGAEDGLTSQNYFPPVVSNKQGRQFFPDTPVCTRTPTQPCMATPAPAEKTSLQHVALQGSVERPPNHVRTLVPRIQVLQRGQNVL